MQVSLDMFFALIFCMCFFSMFSFHGQTDIGLVICFMPKKGQNKGMPSGVAN